MRLLSHLQKSAVGEKGEKMSSEGTLNYLFEKNVVVPAYSAILLKWS
jgi:hypothetical protein